jgi:hypothetical protein
VTPLERHCGWLLHAYPAWYRRERAGEMLGTLLEACPPGRKWPSFRDTRALVTGGLRVRGWTWLLSILWVAAGALITGYTFYVTTKPWDPDLGIPEWSTDPQAFQIILVLAIIAFLALPLPALIAGFIRLRGWRRANWLRAAAWASAWIAGIGLLALASAWGQYPLHSCPHMPQTAIPPQCPFGSPAVVSWRELPVCAAWLVLGAVMTRILAAPAPPRARCMPDNTVTGV